MHTLFVPRRTRNCRGKIVWNNSILPLVLFDLLLFSFLITLAFCNCRRAFVALKHRGKCIYRKLLEEKCLIECNSFRGVDKATNILKLQSFFVYPNLRMSLCFCFCLREFCLGSFVQMCLYIGLYIVTLIFSERSYKACASSRIWIYHFEQVATRKLRFSTVQFSMKSSKEDC